MVVSICKHTGLKIYRAWCAEKCCTDETCKVKLKTQFSIKKEVYLVKNKWITITITQIKISLIDSLNLGKPRR